MTDSLSSGFLPEEVPYITPDLPGIGGKIRVNSEDFLVEEIPAYEPSGSGTHLFMWVEKRDRTTREAQQIIARALGVDERDIGYAGMKDRRALTRQYLSVPLTSDKVAVKAYAKERLLPEGCGVKILRQSLHGNKLKVGHLKGNHFQIRLRDVGPDALAKAQAIARALQERGLPNAFGAQRFGRDGLNGENGRKLVLNRGGGDMARLAKDKFLRRISISAYQSLLFNRVLSRRIQDGLFGTAIPGDLMKKLETGGLFTTTDAGVDCQRVASFEISPTGPIFGHKMMCPMDEALKRETDVLSQEGITLESFRHLKGEAEGTRRPMRIPVAPVVTQDGEGILKISFDLPRGSFATVLLRELMKDCVDIPDQLDEG